MSWFMTVFLFVFFWLLGMLAICYFFPTKKGAPERSDLDGWEEVPPPQPKRQQTMWD